MSETIKICPFCLASLPPDAPAGLCPSCLLRGPVPDAGASSDDAAETAATPVPGHDFGSYQIERMLGAGGMGKVFEAVHRATGRRVALKVMLNALTSEKDRQRFLREGRMAAAVNHPNVVYVHGSEEVEGVPVIAMELVPGGTLSEHIKAASPWSVETAVGATLQIVAGLEAAHAAGVLHRDIKPGNCFIAADGTVKVGDFGLSISTSARVDARLTATGLTLGTPAYASPEQLRGEELDLASDIYSTGATLFHLLMGRPPFMADAPVKLIAEVLGREPEAPHRQREEIPAELSRVVLRCLAKDRKARFQTYVELRDALLPFSEVVPVPAPLWRRMLAGLVDVLAAAVPAVVVGTYWGLNPLEKLQREGTALALVAWLGCLLWHFLYFAIPEGIWGGALGKTLCGLRVVGPDRRTPGLPRALLRAALFMTPQWLAAAGTLLVVSPALNFLSTVAGPLLFVRLRRRNGYAALHDLGSRTRVVVRPRTQSRPQFGGWERAWKSRLPAPTVGVTEASASSADAFGPYAIRGRLWKRGNEELLLGLDPVLHRSLWIHVRPTDSGAVTPLRHDLSRPARLRWLNCGVSETRRWDAYEAVEGVALVNCHAPLPWSAVRFWLLDLAEENIGAARSPFTAPVFSFDHLWLACNGRALLLDFPCPGLPQNLSPAAEFAPRSPVQSQQFLDAVARRTLEGDEFAPPSNSTSARPPRVRVPLHATSFLANLARNSFERVELVAGNLRHLTSTQAEITRTWRAASLTLLPACLAGLVAITALALHFEMLRNDDVALARNYFATRLQPFVPTNAASFTARLETVLGREEMQLLRQRLELVPPLSSAEATTAESAVIREMGVRLKDEESNFVGILCIAPLIVALLAGFIEVPACVFLGFNPVLRLFGIRAVNRAGQRASRLRLLVRSVAIWGPAILGGVVFGVSMLVALKIPGTTGGLLEHWRGAAPPTVVWACLTGLGLLTVAVLYCALRWPDRSLADRLAGTWLVPE